MTLRKAAWTVGVALLSCAVVMAVTGSMFAVLEEREEGIAMAGPFVVLGCSAFLVAALMCCVPIFSILHATRLLPRPSRSAALGAVLAMLPAHAVIAAVLSDGEDWIARLPYVILEPGMMLTWVLPFAIPGAVLGALWASRSAVNEAYST